MGLWRPRLVSALLVTILGVAPLVGTTVTVTAQASVLSVSHSTHPIPGDGQDSGGVTSLCFDATGFSCAGAGYNGTSAQIGGQGWSPSQYWAYGSPGPNGTRHNCTAYAAYRLQRNGYAFPGWTANADDWAAQAADHGVTVNQTPAVGAIAQWNRSTGHVAYVEAVTSTYIETTSDSYEGGTDHLRILLSSAYMPDNFIHFKDVAASAPSVTGFSASPSPVGGPGARLTLTASAVGAQSFAFSSSNAEVSGLTTVATSGGSASDTVMLPVNTTTQQEVFRFTVTVTGPGGTSTASTSATELGGAFTGTGRSQVLFYSSGDQNWWLGSFSTAGALSWKSPGNTKGFGDTASDPTWVS